MTAALRAKTFTYRNKVKWLKERKGELAAEGKPSFQVATPPEFKGHAGIWSPEDLLVASVNACILTTLLAIAEKHGVEFLSYESEAEGTLEMVEGKFMFSRVVVRPRITVDNPAMVASVEQALAGAEKRCLISNSLKSEVVVEPEVKIQQQAER